MLGKDNQQVGRDIPVSLLVTEVLSLGDSQHSSCLALSKVVVFPEFPYPLVIAHLPSPLDIRLDILTIQDFGGIMSV